MCCPLGTTFSALPLIGRTHHNYRSGCRVISNSLHGLQQKFCAAGAGQGQPWPEVRSHLADMWGMALRCADDIKESVRTAAAGALRTLRGLTLRLCDPAATPAADAGEAVALALPLLLDQGARDFAASWLLPQCLALPADCL